MPRERLSWESQRDEFTEIQVEILEFLSDERWNWRSIQTFGEKMDSIANIRGLDASTLRSEIASLNACVPIVAGLGGHMCYIALAERVPEGQQGSPLRFRDEDENPPRSICGGEQS